jgi:hypothetical protein
MRSLYIVTVVGTILALTTAAYAKMFFVSECIDDVIVVEVGQEYAGSTVGVPCMGESSCGYNDRYALWHSYTPQSNQTVAIILQGTAFDTTLAVFDSCGGIELACNNDYDLQSELIMDATAGQTYLIRVAGNDDQTGDYALAIVEAAHADLNVGLTINNSWMYQNLPGITVSNLTANVVVVDDPLHNGSYSYEWEFELPSDVGMAPMTMYGGGTRDVFWTFAAPRCDKPQGLSDSGQTFTVKVTVIGDDYGNTAIARMRFGVALLGDIDNNGIVDLQDRVLVNAFWHLGSVGRLSLRDCDVNCNGIVDVTDRAIVNAVFQGKIGRTSVSVPCPLR